MSTSPRRCPICQSFLIRDDADNEGEVLTFDCGTCGTYSISGTALLVLANDSKVAPKVAPNRFILSGVCRRASDAKSKLTITSDNIEPLISGAPVPRNLPQALDALLLYIRDHSTTFFEPERLSTKDYPVVFSRSETEFGKLIALLRERGLVATTADERFALTVEGWERSEILRQAQPNSRRAFVAMWFDQTLQPAWVDGFAPAISASGYEPIRIDLLQHNNKICDEIVVEIRKAGLVVADFTGQRGGVYFEAGFAMGLGIPVIWTCNAAQINQTHFDTRQYNHILWNDPADLRLQLQSRIEATAPVSNARVRQ